jgi:lycopene cyclase domain-containing protein
VGLISFLAHFTYLGYQVYLVGLTLAIEWGLHYRRLWRQRWRILAATAVVTLYACTLDAWAVAQRWGGFDPRFITGIWLGPLALEEITFWIGTSLATVSAVCAFADLEEAGAPWWRLPFDFILYSDAVQWLVDQTRTPKREEGRQDEPPPGTGA